MENTLENLLFVGVLVSILDFLLFNIISFYFGSWGYIFIFHVIRVSILSIGLIAFQIFRLKDNRNEYLLPISTFNLLLAIAAFFE